MAADPVNLYSQSYQPVADVVEEDAVFSLAHRRVDCNVDESSDNRLLWRAVVEKSVLAGTLARLVRELAPVGEDSEAVAAYRTCFLATYRTFASASDVLSHLTDWYLAVSPTRSPSSSADELKQRTQSSLLGFLRLWLDKYPSDLSSPTLRHQLTVFLQQQQQLQPHHNQQISALLQHLTSLSPSDKPLTSHDSPDKSHDTPSISHDLYFAPEHINILTVPAQTIAQSLTARDAVSFREVFPPQCLHYVRQKLDKASSVLNCIRQFNRLSMVVIVTILRPKELSVKDPVQLRSSIISCWIVIAHHCRLLKNFSSLKAILSSLDSSSVHRLQRSWSGVPNEQMSMFKELRQLTSHEDNHQSSRDILNREGTGKHVLTPTKKVSSFRRKKCGDTRLSPDVVHGVVPYLGTFLSDLTMIHAAYPDRTEAGLINFVKRRKEFEVIAKISLFQMSAANYSYTRNKSVEEWLESSPTLTEQESFELSKHLEEEHQTLHKPSLQPLLKSTIQLLTGQIMAGSSSRTSSSPSNSLRSSSSPSHRHSPSPSRGTSPSPSRGTSPSPYQEGDDSYVARVCTEKHDRCQYRTVMLNRADRTNATIRTAIEKLSLSEPASKYQLLQVITDKGKEVVIPEGATVYYALTHGEGVPLLRLSPQPD